MKHVFRAHGFIRNTLLAILAGLAMHGCGGGGGSSTPPNADPTGYYSNDGTALVKQADNTTDLSITDMQALVHDNRIMMMSSTEALLYDIAITSISGNSFSGTAAIFIDGQNSGAATVSGAITQGSSITGTLTGVGAGNGTFSLIYATSNNEVAELPRLEGSDWTSPVGGSLTDILMIADDAGNVSNLSVVSSGVFSSCGVTAELLTIPNTNMYTMNLFGVFFCADADVDAWYTGLATTRSQTTEDDRLVLMFVHADKTFAFYGELE
jgi:hypothetical protein